VAQKILIGGMQTLADLAQEMWQKVTQAGLV
jgi:hypothetical protein